MFRDLKEYQEIAKIYAEKVSKPENLEERRGSDLSQDQIQKNREGLKNTIMTGNKEGNKPVNTSQSNRQKLSQQRSKQNKGRVEKQFGFLKTKPSSEFKGSRSRFKNKPKPEKKMSNIPVIDGPVNNPEYGKNMSRSKEDLNPKPEIKKPEPKPLTNKQKFDAKFIKKDKGSGFVKRGTPMAQRAENKEKNKMRAQEMAKKRIADKKAGNASPQLSGKERAQQMAKDRLAKKAAMEEYTPYDIVLEYLLSTEQVATIEEANYVMTEMDAETIQGIVESQVNRADIMGGTQAAKNAAKGIGKYTPGPGVTKDFKLDPNFKLKGV